MLLKKFKRKERPAEIIDKDGNIIPDADNLIVNFDVTDRGKIAGVRNGNHSDMSGFQQPKKLLTREYVYKKFEMSKHDLIRDLIGILNWRRFY